MQMNAIHEELLSMELALARKLIQQAAYEEAFHHLERAHILGQMQVRRHVLSHWLMLKVALHRGQIAAAVGQLVRIVLGALGSAVGRVPVGNTGGSNVSMFRRMPIPPDLLEVMERAGQGLPQRGPALGVGAAASATAGGRTEDLRQPDDRRLVDPAGTPLVVAGMPPAPAAYNGQFIRMDVVWVAAK